MRGALSLCLFAACAWPGGLPGTAVPGRMPGGEPYPDAVGAGAAPIAGRLDAAVIVAVEDYTRLGDRVGAEAMAAAWYHYFRETRRVRPWRIVMLRDAEATPRRIERAVESTRFRIRTHGTLWFVFIGHISSAVPGAYGEMWLREGDGTAATAAAHSYAISRVLSRIGYGIQPRAVAVFDGCLASAGRSTGSRLSGTATPQVPGFRPNGKADELVKEFVPPPGGGLAAAVLATLHRVRMDTARARREPADVAIFSAGLGPGCVEHLPGTGFPALSYLMLGGLRGWADRNGDGTVTAVEVITQVTMMLRAGLQGAPQRPQPSSYSADIALARGVTGGGPTLAQLRPRSAAPATEAELLAEPVLWSGDPMIRLDRGSFRIGCRDRRDPDCERDERPAYRVQLSRFFIDPDEVTQAEYQACVDLGVCTPIDLTRCFIWTGETFERGGRLPEPLARPDHPVVCVDWFQAETYCLAVDKHLPTEAEWERAAAGTTGRRFPWGDAPPTCARAHFDGCGEHTRPVGGRAPGATPEGVRDLAGNAAEWVHDWYGKDTYWRPLRDDPTGPERGEVRVVRGGSYYDSPNLLRSTYRYGLNPISGFSTVGFRCAR